MLRFVRYNVYCCAGADLVPILVDQTTNTTVIFMPLKNQSSPLMKNIVASGLFRRIGNKTKVAGLRRVLHRVFHPRPHCLFFHLNPMGRKEDLGMWLNTVPCLFLSRNMEEDVLYKTEYFPGSTPGTVTPVQELKTSHDL
jgi:hypothetical protein